MNILIIDSDAVGLAFAVRCVKAGHKVRYFLKDKEDINPLIGDGFEGIEKIKNWVASVKWADLIFPTSNGDYVQRLEFFKKKGAPVFGPSIASSNLEIKRGEGMKFLEEHGIETPEYQVFNSLKDAEKHVYKTGERFVFKTLGDNEDKSLSYCSKTPADLIARLQRWQKLKMNPKGPVILQKFIEGSEFAVSRWMGKNGFIGLWNENFEHKKMMSGNCGPNTGEQGTVQKYVQDSVLGEEMLSPIEKSLVEMGHEGDVDINCIIDEEGKAWPLEFTCRPGWPAFNIMMAEHIGDPAQWMIDAMEGKDTMEVTTDVAVGIVLAQPDYPYTNLTHKETTDIPIYGITKKNQKYIHPQTVKMAKLPDMEGDEIVEKDMWATAGDYLAVITGTGKTVKKAADRAYKTLKEIKVSDSMYRDDIGERLKEELPRLQEFGYCTDWEYE